MSDVSVAEEQDSVLPAPDFNPDAWNKKIEEAKRSRINFEQQWYMNLSFYRGKQWVVWQKSNVHESGYALVNPKSRRKRLVFNKIMPVIRREFTKVSKEEPQAFVKPNSTDQGDIAAAKTGEAVADYLMEACKFNVARRRASWWCLQTGIGFIKTIYDKNGTLPVGEGGKDTPGKIVYEAPSPFHIIVPFLDIEDIEEQPWVCHERTYDPKVLFDKYGVEVEPTVQSSNSNTETRFRNAINIKNTEKKQCLVREVWVKPCGEYPEGALFLWSNETPLLVDTFPYEHKEYPISAFTHIPSGGFYGLSTIEGLIPMQKEYNLSRSQLAEARDLTSKPALVAPKGSVDVNKLKATPGLVIEYMPGADPPRRLVNPDLPTYIDRILEMTLHDMDDHASQFEVAKGRTPPGIEAASAIAYLQEENDSVLYHTISSIEEAVRKIGRQSLQLVQQYWSTPRIVQVISKSSLQGAIEFKGSDLKNNTDLRVVSGSMAPRSQAAKQATILELLKLGIIDPVTALKYFALSETSAMFEDIHRDIEQVRRENLAMARGQDLQPNMYDDNRIHVVEHQNFMKTQEYELLDGEKKNIFIQHVQKHQEMEVVQVQIANSQPGVNTGNTESKENAGTPSVQSSDGESNGTHYDGYGNGGDGSI